MWRKELMKRKSIILLASAVLGLGLVGGTLAGWAVTDNADPLNIRISPGSISTDTTTHYITLDWGSSQDISNVSNLKIDETRRVGVLDLRADSATPNAETVSGDLRIKMASASGAENALLTYLKVDVYQGDIPAYSNAETYEADELVIYGKAVYKCKADIDAAEEWTAAHWDVDTAKKVTFGNTPDDDGYNVANIVLTSTNMNKANPYTVIAYLGNSITQTVYDQLRANNKQALVTFDWGIGSGVTVTTGKQIYFRGITAHDTSVSSAPFMYAFKGEDVVNAAWPGVRMDSAKVDGWYTLELDITKYDYVVFNDGQASGGVQTSDLSVAELYKVVSTELTQNAYVYDGESSHYALHDDEVEVAYYLVGTGVKVGTQDLDWDVPHGYKVTLDGEGKAVVSITTTVANARLKFYEVASGIWYSNDGNDFVIGDAGSYTITFKPAGSPVIHCA